MTSKSTATKTTLKTKDKSAKKSRKPTSVRDSNAGHDFHVLWATRKVISMLSPDNSLTCVKMEGVHEYDTANLSPNEDHFLAADLTEYYHGEHFAEADQVIISQLKYSTRHPDKHWTLGRLLERSSSTSKDSVVQRLAASYTDLIANGFSTADIVKKTKIQLVSNQPLDLKLENWLITVKSIITTQTKAFTKLQEVIDNLPKKPVSLTKDVKKLHEFLNLSEVDFINFLQVLDLSGCGEDSRMGQHLAMMQEIGMSVNSGDRKDVLLKLTDLVRKEALPEKEKSLGLTPGDILAELEIFAIRDLFPEPSWLILPEKLIRTVEAKDLAQTVIKHKRVLAHGIAGVGKSTTVQQINEHLPAGSQVIMYDSYGGGNYYSINSGRHTLQRALLQLSNELSAQTGIPYLIKQPLNQFDQLTTFQDRLNKAAQIVAAAGGLLVLIIDAADNSVMKAEKESEKRSFVPHLWALDIPSNCRLLMTARTARADSLEATKDTKRFELNGFGLDASATHFRQVFPTAKQKVVEAFHIRTRHNPRIQQYLLERAQKLGTDFAKFLYIFRHANLIPGEIFEDLIRDAVQHQPEPVQANRQLATLICLQRPIPIEVFAGACGISEAAATNFCQALRPGLVFEEGTINFRDEDFETHVRTRAETVQILKATHFQLADYFTSKAETDIYAALVVADHYVESERYADLIQLGINGPSLEIITDSLLRLKTYRRRLQLAIEAAARLKRDADGVKLLLLAAETTRTNDAAKSLVLANLTLANYFGNAENLTEYFDRDDENGYEPRWLGSMHFQLAATYAHDETQRALAEDHLKQGRVWIRRYMKLSEDERYNWGITDNDLANETEAMFWLYGPQVAKKSLNRWTPVQARLDSLAIVTKNIALGISDEEIEQCLAELKLPVLGECMIVAALWKEGRTIQKTRIDRLARRLQIAIQKKHIQREDRSSQSILDDKGPEWPLLLAELFASYKVDEAIIAYVINELVHPFPNRAPLEHGDFKEFIYALRAVTLKAALQKTVLTIEELLPEKYRQTDETKKGSYTPDRYDTDRRRFVEKIGFVLPVYTIRAQTIVGSADVTVISKQIEEGLTTLHTLHESNRLYFIDKQRNWLLGGGIALANLPGQRDLLSRLFEEAPRCTNRFQARELWIRLAKEIAHLEEYQQFALSWLEKAADDAQDDSIAVEDRWKILLNCSIVAFPYDRGLSQEFYRRAVEAADQGVGDEVAYRLGISAHLLGRYASSFNSIEGHQLGAKQAALVEGYKPYISEEIVLPTKNTVEAVTRLNVNAGLRLSSRWDLRNICQLDDAIIPLLTGATAMNQWSANITVPFLRLLGDGRNYTSHALTLLDISKREKWPKREGDIQDILKKLCQWVLRDAPVNFRQEAIQKLVDWANANNLGQLDEVKQLEQALSFVSTLHPSVKDTDPESEYKIEAKNKANDWFSKATKGNLKAFQDCDDLYFQVGGKKLASCLTELGKQISFSQRIDFLNLMGNLNLYQDSREDIAVSLLATFLKDWQRNNNIKEWAKIGLPRFFSRNIGRLTNQGDWPSHVESVCRLPLANSSRAALLLPGVADKLHYLSAEMMCRIAQAVTNTFDDTSARELTTWLLDRLEKQLINDGKTLPFTQLIDDPLALSIPPIQNLAELAWYLFGYPDKRVRWQAAHAMRDILTMNSNSSQRSDLLATLLRLSHTTTSSLIPDENDFYWMSARVWLLLLLEQLAFEIPDQIAPYAEEIVKHALNKSLPHIQIRGLARSTILRLQQVYPQLISSETLEAIEPVNQPTKYLIDRDRYEALGDELNLAKKKADRFKFDHFDIEEHWFKRLGEAFIQSRNTVAVLAEQWICDHWGYTNEDCEKNWPYLNRYEHRLKYYFKTEEPTVESLKMNLTLNALMCTAGELVDQCSVLMENYSDNNTISYWDKWVDDRLSNSLNKGWLADVRSPIPLRPECWGKLPSPWEQRSGDDFLSCMGIKELGREDWIVIYGDYDFGDSTYSGHSYVESLLVNPDMAKSFMRAMQLSEPSRFVFPTFGFKEYHEDADWITDLSSVFLVEPIIQQIDSVDEGLEETDGNLRKISRLPIIPADKIVSGLSLSADNKLLNFKDATKSVVIKREVWNDDLRNERYHKNNPYSSGHRIWMNRKKLLEYMHQTNQDLLIDVRLQRNYHDSTREKRNHYDHGKHLFLILRQDGSLETVDQCCSPWPTNHP